MKEAVLALEKVRPKPRPEIIESSNFVKKSMPRREVATAASKKLNSKI